MAESYLFDVVRLTLMKPSDEMGFYPVGIIVSYGEVCIPVEYEENVNTPILAQDCGDKWVIRFASTKANEMDENLDLKLGETHIFEVTVEVGNFEYEEE